MSTLPIILVGCGAVARQFYTPALRALAATGEVRVAAIVDPSADARALLHAAFPDAIPAADLDHLSLPNAYPAADTLAVIASPPRWHASQTLDALDRGWHVLCEKPMAARAAESARMIAAADSADRVLAVGHYKRFFAASQTLKTLCSPLGALGPLHSFTIAEGGPFNWPAASPAFFQKRETPGGVLLDIGVHVFDLLLWWLGAPSEFTYADDAMGGLEANARVSLRFGAVTGQIHLSRDWTTAQRYEFEFDHGRVVWTVNDAAGLAVTLRGAPHSLRGTLQEPDGAPAHTHAQSFIAHLRHVVSAVKNHTPVLIDGREGARALHLIEACYARRHLLAQPWLAPAESAAAQRLATSTA
ncbi:MAG: Gfo/Idh/MocA family oxidoreductase [Burkholderiales bacterium]|nr:Gfo/Idh/MocA family oxidoreductase [Opitutaceae bacterium]